MKDPTYIGEDNQSYRKVCRNPVMHKQSKHIETKFHFIRKKVKGKEVAIHCTPTENMTTDLLTKSLHQVEKHRYVLLGN